SVTVRWATPANVTSTILQRRITGGTWATIKSYGVTSGTISYPSTGLTRDTRYCFRVVVSNTAGSAMTPEVCALTDFANDETITRARLEIGVADVLGAGTDDPVGVSLNDTYWSNF